MVDFLNTDSNFNSRRFFLLYNFFLILVGINGSYIGTNFDILKFFRRNRYTSSSDKCCRVPIFTFRLTPGPNYSTVSKIFLDPTVTPFHQRPKSDWPFSTIGCNKHLQRVRDMRFALLCFDRRRNGTTEIVTKNNQRRQFIIIIIERWRFFFFI